MKLPAHIALKLLLSLLGIYKNLKEVPKVTTRFGLSLNVEYPIEFILHY